MSFPSMFVKCPQTGVDFQDGKPSHLRRREASQAGRALGPCRSAHGRPVAGAGVRATGRSTHHGTWGQVTHPGTRRHPGAVPAAGLAAPRSSLFVMASAPFPWTMCHACAIAHLASAGTRPVYPRLWTPQAMPEPSAGTRPTLRPSLPSSRAWPRLQASPQVWGSRAGKQLMGKLEPHQGPPRQGQGPFSIFVHISPVVIPSLSSFVDLPNAESHSFGVHFRVQSSIFKELPVPLCHPPTGVIYCTSCNFLKMICCEL